MGSNEFIVIRNKYTNAEYAYPQSQHNDLPVVSVDDGIPRRTVFSRHDLVRMHEYGHAVMVGTATMSLSITYDETE